MAKVRKRLRRGKTIVSVVELIKDMHESSVLYQSPGKTPPSRCRFCHHKINGGWDDYFNHGAKCRGRQKSYDLYKKTPRSVITELWNSLGEHHE